MKSLCKLLVLVLVCASEISARTVKPVSRIAERVLLVGMDGIDVRCLKEALANNRVPYLASIIANGSYSEQLRSQMPTVSIPNWGTVLIGAGVSITGIDSNQWDWAHENASVPSLSGPGKIPDVFQAAKSNQLTTAVYHSWTPMERIFGNSTDFWVFLEPDYTGVEQYDCHVCMEAVRNLTLLALEDYLEHQPELAFLYLEEADTCAHTHTCFSELGQESIASADTNLGLFLDALRAEDLLDETVVMIVVDHGRDEAGMNHGSFTEWEIRAPWMVMGPGIRRNHTVLSAINHEDLAPTALYLLGAAAPANGFMHGKVIDEVLVYNNAAAAAAASYDRPVDCVIVIAAIMLVS